MEDASVENQEPLKEINLVIYEEPRITYVSSLLPDDLKSKLKELQAEFKDCFLWDYKKM